MLKNLYIFEPTVDFGQINPQSTLIDSIDIELTYDQYHTSVVDLSPQQICSIVDYFDTVTFVEQGFDRQSDLYEETTVLLNFLSHRCTILNFVNDSTVDFIDKTEIYQRSEGPVLWTFGCSHSHGIALDSFDQCYSSILSKTLDRPLKSITRPGTSIEWSLRHLIHARLQPGDTVIWQLTTPGRFTKGSDKLGQVREVMLKDGLRTDIDFFTDSQIFYQHVNCLNIGLKFLRSQQVSFAFISTDPQSAIYYDCVREYTKHPEYCYLPGYMVDLANNGIHFGPLTHQNIANGLLAFLTR
jgi:hypothetical protein